MLLALFAVVGVVAARYPENVAADGVETAVSAQTDPTDEDLIDETDYPDPFTAAAEAIGITEDALWEALDSGKTVAEVAQDNGVDVQKVIDAMVAAENSFIDQLLADGEIDAAEADEWRSEIVEYITESVNEVMDDEYFEEDFVDPFVIAADTIGVDEDALWEAMENGKTVADIATENSVDPQAVIDALVAEEAQWIDEMVAEEEISAEEAEEWRAEIAEYAAEFVNNGMEFFEDEYFDEEFDEDFDEDFYDPITTVAELIGIDEDALWEALEAGKSVADVATENNVDPQTIIDALVAEELEWIDELLAEGEIDEAEAEEWRTEAAEYMAEFVNEAWDFDEFEDFEDGVELYLPAECVIEADGTALADLEIPEACEDGFAVLGEAATE